MFRRYRVYVIFGDGERKKVGRYKTLELAQRHASMVQIGRLAKNNGDGAALTGVMVLGPDMTESTSVS